MKKWLLALPIIVIAFLLSIYVFIPSHLVISKITPLNCPLATAYRFIANTDNWNRWWPKNEVHKASSPSVFSYRGDDYLLTQKLLDGIVITIHHKKQSITTNLTLIPLKDDSLVAEWQCELIAGWDPIARFRRYNEAVQLKNNLEDLLQHLQSFIQNKDTVYGIHIQRLSTIDTLLISAKYLSDHYPGTNEIYQYLQPLHDYLKQQGALETAVPDDERNKNSGTPIQNNGRHSNQQKISSKREPGTKNHDQWFFYGHRSSGWRN